MSQFIIELVSNASLDVHPENTLSRFTNILPEQINLGEGEEWEVALMEIGYPAWYNNITEGLIRWKPIPTLIGSDAVIEIRLKPGLYKSLQNVYDDISREFHAACTDAQYKAIMEIGWPRLSYDYFTGKTLFSFGKFYKNEDVEYKGWLHLGSRDIANILGFEDVTIINSDVECSTLPADIQRFHSIMVYSDLIDYGIIGDTRAPILRCFPMISRVREGELSLTQFMNYQTFEKLQFRKVSKSSFHSIRIELRDATGEPIPFAGIGLTRLTLLFRKVQKSQ